MALFTNNIKDLSSTYESYQGESEPSCVTNDVEFRRVSTCEAIEDITSLPQLEDFDARDVNQHSTGQVQDAVRDRFPLSIAHSSSRMQEQQVSTDRSVKLNLIER